MRRAWTVILGLSTCALQTFATLCTAEVALTVVVPPPPLPAYVQPPVAEAGDIWTPGYWAYDSIWGFYWVPGTWIVPPRPGLVWTPGYWAYSADSYVFHSGYWDTSVGFYGGVDYGNGYNGVGFTGGFWRNDTYFYNRSVTNVSRESMTNVYFQAIVDKPKNPVSYAGGDGVPARPTAAEEAFARQKHVGPTEVQEEHVAAAMRNPLLREITNHGMPSIAATARPNEFSGPGTTAAQDVRRPVPSGRAGSSAAGPQAGERPVPLVPGLRRDPRPEPVTKSDRSPEAQQSLVERPQRDLDKGVPQLRSDRSGPKPRSVADRHGAARPDVNRQRPPQDRQR